MEEFDNNLPGTFSLLVKPASADCNLCCDYCFYLDRSSLYPETKVHRMSDSVLERMISSYMATRQHTYSFGWQGGEPTLMGVEFLKKVTELQKKYGRQGAIVSNGLQTNATLIDDELAAHLSKYRFLVGVSIDGPAEIHNRYRQYADGRGSHAAVLRGIECLNRHNVEFNALVLVSSANIKKAIIVYNYLRNHGINYHQYIPCVEFDNFGQPLPYSIAAKEWGDFLCEIFDEWIIKDRHKVSIRLFDAILGYMVDRRYSMCTQGGNCRQYFLVEYNGDVYPCDFFVERHTKLGNIMKNNWKEVGGSSRYRSFGNKKADWNSLCSCCDYLEFCSGDCLRHRVYRGETPNTLSWLCEGWKKFYAHNIPSFQKIALSILNERQLSLPSAQRKFYDTLPRIRIGWNDPCYCGSGRKYRLCHGAAKGKNKQVSR